MPVLEPSDMLVQTFPSLASLESSDDAPLTAELPLLRLRAQLALVRALADEIEHLARPATAAGLSSQLTEEIARLGCRLFEASASMRRSQCPPDGEGFAEGLWDAEGAGPSPVIH